MGSAFFNGQAKGYSCVSSRRQLTEPRSALLVYDSSVS
jgi:hypothetical protein